jgi:hypothetical protein
MLLAENPSLKTVIDEVTTSAYRYARGDRDGYGRAGLSGAMPVELR